MRPGKLPDKYAIGRPKSRIFTSSAEATIILPGFRSPCTTPLPRADSRASATRRAFNGGGERFALDSLHYQCTPFAGSDESSRRAVRTRPATPQRNPAWEPSAPWRQIRFLGSGVPEFGNSIIAHSHQFRKSE